MKFISYLFLLAFSLITALEPLNAQTADAKESDKAIHNQTTNSKKNTNKSPSKHKKRPILKVGLGFVDASSTEAIDGPGVHYGEMFSEPILLGSLGVVLWPKTYAVTLSYSGTFGAESILGSSVNDLTRGSYTNKVDYVDFEATPSFTKTSYGSFGFGLEVLKDNRNLRQISQTGVNILDQANDGKNPIGSTSDGNLVLDQNDSYGYQSDFTRWKLFYTLPDLCWKYFPSLGAEVAYEKGERFLVVTASDVVSNGQYGGTRWAFGIFKSKNSLKDGFSLSKLRYFVTNYNADYFNFRTNTEDSLNGASISGFEVAFNYRTTLGSVTANFSLFYEQQEDDFNNESPRQVEFGGLRTEFIF